MHRPDKSLVEYARQCGFELQPGFNGREHYLFVHPDGHTVNASQSPSDHRAYKNARAQMSRLTGIYPDRKKAAKYKRQSQGRPFSIDQAKRERRKANANRGVPWVSASELPLPEHITKRHDYLKRKLSEARALASETGYPFHINEARRLTQELQVFKSTHMARGAR